jgi:SAM-dependent methyltransferase
MSTQRETVASRAAPASGLPKPHRCPWWVQYMLVSPLRRLAEPPRKLVGDHVKPGMTIVDPGCGFGYVSVPLAKMVGPQGKVISVDIEPRALERVERRARRARVSDRIVTRVCTPKDLGLADFAGEVDLVSVVHTLHEFQDLPDFLGQVATLLKPDGRLWVVEPPGHVTPEHFAAEMECCRLAGFKELDHRPLGGGRMTALLAPPAA